MGIAGGMLLHKPHRLQHLVYLLFNVFFVLFTVDHKSFRNNVMDRHAGIQRGDRILKDHLNFVGNQVLALSGAGPFFMIRLSRLDLLLILCYDVVQLFL